MYTFDVPTLISKRGKISYAALVSVWWSVAFVIAAAILDNFGLVALIAASTILILTCDISPFLALSFIIQRMIFELTWTQAFIS